MTAFRRSHSPRGVSIIEFVVACSLLGSLILFVVPSAIRIGQLQRDIRQDRIAMDEITNHLDRLAQLPPKQIQEELDRLAPSVFAKAGLPNPNLSGTLSNSEEGYRLALVISWESTGRDAAPLTMATWVFPASSTESIAEDPAP